MSLCPPEVFALLRSPRAASQLHLLGGGLLGERTVEVVWHLCYWV